MTAEHAAHFNDLPALVELARLPQWVLWQREERDGKPTKVPYTAVAKYRRGKASVTDAATWRLLWEVAQHLEQPLSIDGGVGFVLTKDDPYVAIDLDHCIDPETGAISVAAQAIIALAATYTEISPSGTGLRMIGRGTKTGTVSKRGPFELYDHARFVTITGDHLPGTPTTIADCSDRMAAIEALMFPPKPTPATKTTISSTPSTAPALADQELLDRMFAGKDGAMLRQLWGGDWSGYGSQSEADLRLCSALAFYSNNDPARVDTLFRQSALWRPKWDEGRGEMTYGQRTVTRALGSSGYQPHPPTPATPIPIRADIASAPIPPGAPCADRIAELEARIAVLEAQNLKLLAENRQLVEERTAIMAVKRNAAVRPIANTVIAAAFDYAQQRSAGKVDADGWGPIVAGRVGDAAGVSAKAASAHIAEAADKRLLEKRVKRRYITVDDETGEIVNDWRSTLEVRFTGSVLEQLNRLATFQPETPRNWGGKRAAIVCPEHPDAAIEVRRTAHCADCGRELEHLAPVIQRRDPLESQDGNSELAPPSRGSDRTKGGQDGNSDRRLLKSQDAPAALRGRMCQGGDRRGPCWNNATIDAGGRYYCDAHSTIALAMAGGGA